MAPHKVHGVQFKLRGNMENTLTLVSPAVVSSPETETVKVSKRFFDLDRFESVKLEVTIPKISVASVSDALQIWGGQQQTLLFACNLLLNRQARKVAKANMAPAEGNMVPVKTFLSFVNQFRAVPQYSAITERKQQTQAIYAAIKSRPEAVAAIKLLATMFVESDDDDADLEGEEITE